MHFIKSLSIMFILSLLGMSVTSAGAASFDCNKATTVTEIAICADPKLSALDEGLQIAYRDIFVSNFDDAAASAKTEQRNWITERNLCGSDVFCLIEKYKKRHIELSNANYDNWHEPFTGSFLPAAMNGSLTAVLNTTLKDWDLVSIDSIIGASYTGMSITTALIVRKKSATAMHRCGMDICNSNSAYFALIHGNIDENFSGTNVRFHLVDDLVRDSVSVTLDVLSNNRVEIEVHWLRGGSTTNARYFPDGGLRVISKSSGGVTSPGAATMHTEYLDYDHNVRIDEYGYTFSGSIKTIPSIIDTNIMISECKFDSFEQCDYEDAYNLGVTLFSDPDTINDALLVFDYLVKRDFLLARHAYDQVAGTIEEMRLINY